MVRPPSVAGISKGVTRSATLVSPAATKSCVGSGWVTVKLDAGRIDGRPVAVDLAPVARPQAATRSDALIATPTSTRFIDRAKDSPANPRSRVRKTTRLDGIALRFQSHRTRQDH